METLKILFGFTKFPKGQGLYVAMGISKNTEWEFSHMPVFDGNIVVGWRVWLLGAVYSVVLTDNHSLFPELQSAIFRPPKITTKKTRNSLVLKWTGGTSSQGIESSYFNEL